MEKSELSKFGEVRIVKNYTMVYDPSLKKALIMKKRVQLEDASKANEFTGMSVKVYTPEEIKKRHMGKIKCSVKYASDDELKRILQIYFS